MTLAKAVDRSGMNGANLGRFSGNVPWLAVRHKGRYLKAVAKATKWPKNVYH